MYWNKATADLPSLTVPVDWMDPLRRSLERLVVADGCVVPSDRSEKRIPVVTYINR